MNKQEFTYVSADTRTQIHAIKWIPDGQPRAVLQIIHGMVEYVDRYDDFARFMAEHGFLVVGEDHLGHGGSVLSPEHLGYFGEHGNEWIISDIHHLRTETQTANPGIPYFMLGHSMGSFLLRQYITEPDKTKSTAIFTHQQESNSKTDDSALSADHNSLISQHQESNFSANDSADSTVLTYANGLAGVIIMGTGWQPKAALLAGETIAKMQGIRKLGVRSKLLEVMAFGTYLKRIEHPHSVSDWLTKDREIVKAYRKDPHCTFHFTPNAFYHMFRGMEKAHDISRMKKLPAGLPILFVSGVEDPVGNWGEAVRKAYMIYQDNTECDVAIQLYLDDRHEILNETDREDVYHDLLAYLGTHIQNQ